MHPPILRGRRDAFNVGAPIQKQHCGRLALLELETEALIRFWPDCPRFASRRVDDLIVRRDQILGVAR